MPPGVSALSAPCRCWHVLPSSSRGRPTASLPKAPPGVASRDRVTRTSDRPRQTARGSAIPEPRASVAWPTPESLLGCVELNGLQGERLSANLGFHDGHEAVVRTHSE